MLEAIAGFAARTGPGLTLQKPPQLKIYSHQAGV
jgi:hypothetical protein